MCLRELHFQLLSTYVRNFLPNVLHLSWRQSQYCVIFFNMRIGRYGALCACIYSVIGISDLHLFIFLHVIPQLVENVSTCLIKIAERVHHSSDMLDELCKHGLIHQATNLIDLNCRTNLCQPVYTVCGLFVYVLPNLLAFLSISFFFCSYFSMMICRV